MWKQMICLALLVSGMALSAATVQLKDKASVSGCKQAFDVVQRMWALGVAGELHALPGGMRCDYVRGFQSFGGIHSNYPNKG